MHYLGYWVGLPDFSQPPSLDFSAEGSPFNAEVCLRNNVLWDTQVVLLALHIWY